NKGLSRMADPSMAELKEARVPDIGGYDGVPVIEVLVAVGDTVTADQGLVTLESDKATMEVPAPFDGVVRELKVKVGDEIGEGAVVAMIEPAGDAGGDAAGESGGNSGAEAKAGKDKAPEASKSGSAQPEAPDRKQKSSEGATEVEPTNVSEPDNLAKREAAAART